ncbi:signal peptidase II [Sulfitobacter donghicola]|uniref:Lipoprotein signal peptidase n=1 Tax=Sulfitobacter donghicola DSW-25 = KCTC 12864 = JCM 14565 TaxID=1300350 RepID=A0A073IJ78_9RHOB|nr:signal peptidase II [Sulfitobacter donghicola]KEJ90378.1 peptidase A8 [Sulfitobacter donghicola DSW-25 = KCTC 12864 = JCM 14565]KIN67605.1 Lipoprotein signal peptidase [Sulfitobacter donghicola DSW-25 = KCTC 12864 = JCM 14565]
MRMIFWAGFWAFVIDQISKYVVIHMMELARIRSIDVLPPLLNFRYGENRGINFGLLADGSDLSRWILISLAIAICIAILIWARKNAPRPIAKVSAGLLVGGALANVVDRLIYGYVLDFLNMSCCGINNPFVFNLADVFIFAGALGLIFFAEGDDKPSKNKPRNSKAKKAG